ncbi:MAG: class I SAM-dependent methyltransferase [Pirellulales bacterium]|nr:class I SAM-dependent methyltransferase [Pirellulales bacterium]
MFDSGDYRLLDFGDARRLERFGEYVLDRPAPAAEGIEPSNPEAWELADARFQGREDDKGEWTYRRRLPERWTVAYRRMRFELKRTDFGHLGIFPEQAENWRWLAELFPSPASGRGVRGEGASPCCKIPSPPAPLPQAGEGSMMSAPPPKAGEGSKMSVPSPQAGEGSKMSAAKRPLKVLNLFAYTGGSTLAAAAAGMEVVHVDAARNVLAWARRNAELSGLVDAPIRWIAEEAMKFVKRELKRGSRYDAVILDPPSYGHGPRGEVWRLSRHLRGLLRMCVELTAGRPEFMLLTCHTPGYDAERLCRMVAESGIENNISGKQLTISTDDGRRLPAGVVVQVVGQALPENELCQAQPDLRKEMQ